MSDQIGEHTFLFADLAGFTALTEAMGDLDAADLANLFHAELSDLARGYAAQVIKPQARVLARAMGIECARVDLAVLRGEREPELRLFAA